MGRGGPRGGFGQRRFVIAEFRRLLRDHQRISGSKPMGNIIHTEDRKASLYSQGPGVPCGVLSFLGGAGEMGARLRAYDWETSPLGPPEEWPSALRGALGLCLGSNFPTAVYWGPESRILYNDAWRSVLAEKHPWALARPAREVAAEVWDVIGPQWGQVQATGEGFSTTDQKLMLQRAGRVEETYWSYNLTPIRDESGQIRGLFNQALETTPRVLEKRRADFLLALSDEFHEAEDARAIAATAVDALGPHLRVTRVAYTTITEDGQTAILGSEYVHNAPRLPAEMPLEAFGAANLRQLRAGRTSICEDVRSMASPEGSAFEAGNILSFVAVPLVREGRLRAALCIDRCTPHHWSGYEVALTEEVASRIWDAVERARAEAALRELNDTLEQRIAERTHDLMQTEEQLRQSQKMEAVGQLTGGLAHDFNNLLTGIIGSLELVQSRLQQGRLTDLTRFIAAAEESARRSAALTHRLLAFSRRQPLDPRATDINQLIGGMAELIRRTMGPAVTVKIAGMAGLWNTLVDPNQLENTLLNLCINARDAMPRGWATDHRDRQSMVGSAGGAGARPVTRVFPVALRRR